MTERVFEADNSLPLVQFTVCSRRGAACDPIGKEGLTRLAGRLMRRSAGGLTTEVLDEKLDRLGAAVGVEASGSTVGFSGAVLRRSLPRLSPIMRDLLGNPSLPLQEFERLKRETIAELQEVQENDRALARVWFRRSMFPAHSYGRPTAGTRTSLAAITLEDVQDFAARAFGTTGLVLGVSGDLKDADIDQLEAAWLQGLPRKSPAVATVHDPAGPSGRSLCFVDKPERTQVQVVIGGLGTSPKDEDHTALLVGNTIFGGTFTSRLTQEVRAKRGWSYSAYTDLPYDRARRSFTMWTFPQASDAPDCIRLKLDLLADWVENGITEQELEYAKSYLTRSHVFAVDTAAKRMSLAVDELLYELPASYHQRYTERIQSTTRSEVNAAIRRRISTSNLQIVVVGTHSEIGAAVEAAIPNLKQVSVVAYDQDEPPPTLEIGSERSRFGVRQVHGY